MANPQQTPLAGWGLYPRTTAQLAEPEDRISLERAMQSTPMIARGLGRSYGDAALHHQQHVIGMTRFDRILDFDATTGVVHCEAGVSLSQLIDSFAPQGWFPLITPGTRHVTIGGCIANDVHGKAHHVQGSFLASVQSLRMRLANGAIIDTSPTLEPAIFFACFGGMGLLGVILEAKIQLRRIATTYFRQQAYVAHDLSSLLAEMEVNDATFPYSVANIDPLASGARLGRGVLTVGDHAKLDEIPARLRQNPLKPGGRAYATVPFELPTLTINRWTLPILHFGIKQVLARAAPIVHADPFFYPLDALAQWNRGYGHRGFTQYQVVVPREDGEAQLRRLLQTIAKAGQLPSLNVLKRLGPGNAAPLSFPIDGYTLAIDFPIRHETPGLLHRLDAMVSECGGRVYLGKDAFLQPHSFIKMYPRLQEWREIKERLDPQQHFVSDLSRRIGLTSHR